MDTEEAGNKDQDKTIRVVTYREDRGPNTRNHARRETRGIEIEGEAWQGRRRGGTGTGG